MNIPISITRKFLERLSPTTTLELPPTGRNAGFHADTRTIMIPKEITEISANDIRRKALGFGLEPDEPGVVSKIGAAIPYHELGHERQYGWFEQELPKIGRDPQSTWRDFMNARDKDSDWAELGQWPIEETTLLNEIFTALGKTRPATADIRIQRTGHENPDALHTFMYRMKPSEWAADRIGSEYLDRDILSDPRQGKLFSPKTMAAFRTTLGRNAMAAELPVIDKGTAGPSAYRQLEARLRQPLQVQLPFSAEERALIQALLDT